MSEAPSTDDALDGVPVTFLAIGAVADAEAFAEYGSKATTILQGAGGEVVGRHRAAVSLLGERAPGVVFAMRFPNDASVRSALESEAYRAIVPIRDRAFECVDFWLGPAG